MIIPGKPVVTAVTIKATGSKNAGASSPENSMASKNTITPAIILPTIMDMIRVTTDGTFILL